MYKPGQAAAGSQQDFSIETRRLPKATASIFYRKLEDTLDAIGFAAGIREICMPAYADISSGGRPDTAIYQAALKTKGQTTC